MAAWHTPDMKTTRLPFVILFWLCFVLPPTALISYAISLVMLFALVVWAVRAG